MLYAIESEDINHDSPCYYLSQFQHVQDQHRQEEEILSLSEFCGYHWKKKMLISDFKVFKIQARNTLNINDSKLTDKLQTYKISYFVCHSAESTFQQKLVEVNTLTEDYFREIR